MSEIENGRRRKKPAKMAGATPQQQSRRGPARVIDTGFPLDRRNQILQLAAKRFAEFGYEATTVREIADDAKILSGSIYHHFNTKDDILDEIIRKPAILMGDRIRHLAACESDPETKLVALVILQLDALTKNHDAYSILYNERRFLRRHALFNDVPEYKSYMTKSWGEVLRSGIELGYFRESIDKFLIISTSHRIINTSSDWFMRDGNFNMSSIRKYSLDEVIEFNIDLILRSVRHDSKIAEPIPRAAAESLVRSVPST